MSSITAGTSAGTALVHTADTTGSLLLKTGVSGTTALTLDGSQNATFAGGATFTGAVTAASFSGTTSTATNLEGGSLGTIPYQYAAGATNMLAPGTAGQVLTSNGIAAPIWSTVNATPFSNNTSLAQVQAVSLYF